MDKILEKAKNIKLVIFDVDGVLTDGKLFLTDDNVEIKAYNSLDGLGIKFLLKHGIDVGIITARQSETVKHRMQSLGIKYVYQGNLNKVEAYDHLLKKLHLTDKDVAYMGDDLPDLPLIRRAKLGIAPANANEFVKQSADYVTAKTGGHGAAREACDLVLKAQSMLEKLYEDFS